MDAILYTSNSGFTAEYAKILGERTGLPVFPLKQAGGNVPDGADVLYLGWLMAGVVKGYKKAAGRWRVRAVCGVGMGAAGGQTEEVRRANALPEELPLFTLQGGFDLNRLHGIYRFMMRIMKNTAGKALAGKTDRTPDEEDMLALMQQGGSRVSEAGLSDVLAWYAGATENAPASDGL